MLNISAFVVSGEKIGSLKMPSEKKLSKDRIIGKPGMAVQAAQPKLRLAGKLLRGLDCGLQAKLGQKAGLPVPKHYCRSFLKTTLVIARYEAIAHLKSGYG